MSMFLPRFDSLIFTFKKKTTRNKQMRNVSNYEDAHVYTFMYIYQKVKRERRKRHAHIQTHVDMN